MARSTRHLPRDERLLIIRRRLAERAAGRYWVEDPARVRFFAMAEKARAKDPEHFEAELYKLRDSLPPGIRSAVSDYIEHYERERARRGAKAAAEKKRARYPEDDVRAAVAKVMSATPDASPRVRNTAIKRELKHNYPARDFSRWIRRYIDEYLANRIKR